MKIAFVTYLPPYSSSIGDTFTQSPPLSQNPTRYSVWPRRRAGGGKIRILRRASLSVFALFGEGPPALHDSGTSLSPCADFLPALHLGFNFPTFHRQVARDLEKKQWGVSHVQHCWQYVPVVRAFNPTAKLFFISTLSGSHDAIWRSSSAAASTHAAAVP